MLQHQKLKKLVKIFFLAIYNSKSIETLDTLSYHRFQEKIASSLRHVDPALLPPTSDAAKYHSYCVYHQVCEWKRIQLIPELWGWKIENREFWPIMMDKPPAPENLLEIIKCNCQSDCVTRACSCRKHQLKCSIVCGNCKETACLNAMEVESEDNQSIGEDE